MASDRQRDLERRHRQELRESCAAILLDLQDHLGEVPIDIRRQYAAKMEYSDRTVRRILAEGGLRTRHRPQLRVTEEWRVLWADNDCNVSQVHRLIESELRRRCQPVPSRRNLARAFGRLDGPSRAERAQFMHGDRKRRDLEPRLPIEYQAIGETYETDGKQIPIECDDAEEVWSINVIDCRSKYWLAAEVVPHRPKTIDVQRALRKAYLADDAESAFCGLPEALRFDNGGENTADQLLEDLGLLHIDPLLCDPDTPEQKGTVEALNGWVQRIARRHPFCIDKPKRLNKTRYRPPGRAPSFESLKRMIERTRTHYNHEKPHSGLGGLTPAAQWLADLGSEARDRLRPATELHLRPLLRGRRQKCRYTSKGIQLDGNRYVVLDMPELVGREVDIAFDGKRPPTIAVYFEGEYLAAAYDARRLTHQQLQRFYSTRTSARQQILKRLDETLQRGAGASDQQGTTCRRAEQDTVPAGGARRGATRGCPTARPSRYRRAAPSQRPTRPRYRLRPAERDRPVTATTGIPGARMIPTPAFLETWATLDRALNEGKIAAFDGPDGSGRRTAIAYWLNRQSRPLIDIAFGHERLGAGTAMHRALATMYAALAGTAPEAPLRHLHAAVVGALQNNDSVVWIHNAQIQEPSLMRAIRSLWHRGGSGFRLVLSGDARLSADLLRLGLKADLEEQHINPLRRLDVVRWIPGYHPMFNNTPDRILSLVDDAYAHGLVGRWAEVAAESIVEYGGAPRNQWRFSRRVAEAVIRRIGGR